MNKKADIAWEYIAAIVICVAVLIIAILFADFIKDKITEGLAGLTDLFGG